MFRTECLVFSWNELKYASIIDTVLQQQDLHRLSLVSSYSQIGLLDINHGFHVQYLVIMRDIQAKSRHREKKTKKSLETNRSTRRRQWPSILTNHSKRKVTVEEETEEYSYHVSQFWMSGPDVGQEASRGRCQRDWNWTESQLKASSASSVLGFFLTPSLDHIGTNSLPLLRIWSW